VNLKVVHHKDNNFYQILLVFGYYSDFASRLPQGKRKYFEGVGVPIGGFALFFLAFLWYPVTATGTRYSYRHPLPFHVTGTHTGNRHPPQETGTRFRYKVNKATQGRNTGTQFVSLKTLKKHVNPHKHRALSPSQKNHFV
jgi:hypothetical protein